LIFVLDFVSRDFELDRNSRPNINNNNNNSELMQRVLLKDLNRARCGNKKRIKN